MDCCFLLCMLWLLAVDFAHCRYIIDFPKLRSYSLLQQSIGRAAHVELLCSPTYIPIFTWCLLTADMFAVASQRSGGFEGRKREEEAIEITMPDL